MRPKGFNDYGLDDFSRDFDKLIGTDNVPPYLNDGPRVKAVVFRGVPSECFQSAEQQVCEDAEARDQPLP